MLSNAGDHVPVTLLVDVVGKAARASPLQIGLTAANVGVTFEFTVIVPVALTVPQPPLNGIE